MESTNNWVIMDDKYWEEQHKKMDAQMKEWEAKQAALRARSDREVLEDIESTIKYEICGSHDAYGQPTPLSELVSDGFIGIVNSLEYQDEEIAGLREQVAELQEQNERLVARLDSLNDTLDRIADAVAQKEGK